MRALLLLCLAAPALAQTPASPVRLVPVGDTVLVYILQVPSDGGFVVYRRPVTATPAGFEKRTVAPVSGPTDPAALAGRLGPDLPMALRAVRAVDEDELMRRLRSDRFASGVLTLVSRRAASALGRLYADGGAVRGADYEYRVVFTGTDGKETTRSWTGRVHVVDVAPLSPSGLTTTGADHEIRVAWRYPTYLGAPTDFTIGFHVYRADGAGAVHRITANPVLRNDANGAAFSFVDRDVTGGAYAYQITAVDLAGRESAPTAAAPAHLVDRTPPAIPVELAVRNGNNVVDITWRMSPELDAAGYHIERSLDVRRGFRRLDRALIPVRRPVWTDTVPGGHQYFYRIIAVDSSGNASAPSNPVDALPVDHTPPPPPTALVLTTSRHRITARWGPSTSGDFRGYYVYRGSGSAGVRLTGRPLTVTQFVDSGTAGRGLTPGGKYLIRVTALDSTFNESAPLEAWITIPDDQPPTPPSAVAARNVAGRYVEVSWSASGSRDVQTYAVTRAGGPADTGSRATHRFPAAARSWRDTAVVHGVRYTYRLTAIDSAGNVSTPRADSVLFRDFTPPPAPRMAAARVVAGVVEVRWERVVGLELVGYNVYRSSLPTGAYRKLTRAPASLLVFTDSTGRAGFYYTVRAVDRSGNESAPSPVAPVARR